MWIKKFHKFKECLKESLSIWYDSLLNSINAEEVNINILKLEGMNTDLQNLNENDKFIDLLSKSGLKKSDMEDSTNYETFLSTPCRFMFIYDIKANELETPYYLLLQIYNQSLGQYEDTKCYKINADIKNFYDQLSSKTINVEDDGNNYIYDTSNSNEWTLTSNNANDIYKNILRKGDLENVVKSRNAKIKNVQTN